MIEPPDIDPEKVSDVNTFRILFKQLQLLIAGLHGLIHDLRTRLSTRDAELAERDAQLTERAAELAERDAQLTERAAELVERDAQIEALERRILGRKSERVRSVEDEARQERTPEEAGQAHADGQRRRKRNRAQRQEVLPVEDDEHPVCACPNCSGTDLVQLGEEVSQELDLKPAQAVIRRVRRHKVLCRGCGQISTADGPPRVAGGGHYGPGVYAEVVVAKCADALAINRVSTRLKRAGCHISRSTLTDLFHRAAALLAPIYLALVQRVARARYVNADETSHKVWQHEECRGAFVWTFIAAAEGIETFVFSPNRSGQTPARILGGTSGDLQVDGYTGYNIVSDPDGRVRLGCIAHGRRKFFDASRSAPDEAGVALGFIRDLYGVERSAAKMGILGTEAHLQLRQSRSRPICEAFREWLQEQDGRDLPKGPLGTAIGYTIRQWDRLTAFLDDPKRRLDNNIAEGALRIWAVGRHTYLWVGNDQAGENLAILRTIVATCVRNGVNPLQYITDVLIRIQTHPQARIDELLPMNWNGLVAAETAVAA